MNEYRFYNYRENVVAILFTDYETALEMKPILEVGMNVTITSIAVVSNTVVAEYSIFSGEKVEAK